MFALTGCSYWPFGDKDEAAGQAAVEQAPTIPIEITGVEGLVATNIANSVTLAKRLCTTPRAYLSSLAEEAQEQAKTAMRALGYYRAEVEVVINDSGDCPMVTFQVQPGQPVTVDAVNIELKGQAADDDEFQERVDSPPIKVGQALNHADYGATKALIESTALERGYLDGHFTHKALRVEPATGSATIELDYDSGPRYSIGDITIRQSPEFINESLVRRFLDYQAGQAYDAALVPRFYQALAANEYFTDVDVRPLLSEPVDHTIPLVITLTERPKHNFSAGIGATTDELIRTRFSYANRRVNRRGHRFDSDIRASAIEQSFSARYRIPRQHPTDEWLSIQAGGRREDVDAFKTLEAQFGASETKRRPWGIMETRFVNFNRQTFDIGSAPDQTTSLLIPGMSWNKATANDPLYPTRGYSTKLELRGAANEVLSDTSFARAQASLNVAYGLPWDMRVLTRTTLGALWVSNFAELPPSERFFAGGDNSIRGYDIDALGPLDDGDEVIGGRFLGVASLELEKTITGPWGMALFVDAGNAFGGPGKSDGIKTGVGLGLRWRSPIGPVRVDLARPMDGRETVRLHLRIGADL